MKRRIAQKIALGLLALVFLFCPAIASAAPTITVSGNSVTILGAAQTISLTCTLIDPNGTGLLKSGSNIITVFVTSSATPGTTATCGPIYANDTVADGFGNLSTTYYKVAVFTVTNGIVASTPAKQQFYAFTGSGTVDLSTATPLAPSFFTGPNGSVVVPGTFSTAQLVSTVATGTPPIVVASTTQVANLNASQLGGLNPPASAIVGVSDTQTLTNKTVSGPSVTVGAGSAITSSGAGGTVASQGVDINASNQVTALHFGSTAVPTEGAVTTGRMMNVDSSGNIAAAFMPVTANTCTMSSGTCNVNAGGLSAGSYHSCFASWNGTGTLTGVVKSVLTGVNNTCTVTSSVGTDTAHMNVYWVWSSLP